MLTKFMGRAVLACSLAAAAPFASAAMAQDIPEGGTISAVKAADTEKRIAFLSFQNNPFWTPVTEGAHAANAYLEQFNGKVDFIDLGNELAPEAVVAGIEAALVQQYDGIVVVPIFDGTARIIDEAVDEGVPVISIVAEGAQPSKRMTFIGQDGHAAGQQIGAFLAEKMEGNGKLGVITGYFGATQHQARMDGALDYLKEHAPDIEIVGPFENRDKADAAYGLVQDMTTAHPDLKMVYVTAGGPYGAAKAVRDLDLVGKIGVVGFDHTPENIAYLKTGEMVGLLDQAPFQQAFDGAVMMFNHLVDGSAPVADVVTVEGNLLTPDQVK